MSLINAQAEIAELILKAQSESDIAVPAENLCIYRNNINSTLLKSLSTTYPLIVKLLGEDFFKVAAREYIKKYPSRSSNLHDYGEYFSRFLAQFPPVKNLIYLVEVAEFEWICHSLYFAADHHGLDINRLRQVTPDQYGNLHFSLHPASHIIKFHYPILDLVEFCKYNNDTKVDINSGGINLQIIRRDLELLLIPLADSDYAFLHALEEGRSLAEALKEAQFYDREFDLEAKLPYWIQNKSIVDCDAVVIANFDSR